MAHKEIEAEAERLLEPVLEKDGIELVDVEYVRERNWILRIYIDKEGGVDLNDCQTVSEKAGALLDEKDLIPDNYMLEVSSPGLDRVLKKDKDFIRYTGEDVDVKLFAPLEGTKTKALTARLDGLAEDGSLLLTPEGGEQMTLARDKISQVRLHFSF
jgi:ribosome maturation factor RimP